MGTSFALLVLRLNHHPDHVRFSASRLRAERAVPGARAGAIFDIRFDTREAAALARLLITPGSGGAATLAAAVGTRPAARRATLPEVRTARPDGPVPSGAGRRWVLLLALGWLVQVGLRVWFGRMQVGPLANPDETAYLVAARVLADGPATDLSNSTMYQGGYPLLITPVYWFTSNPTTIYHAVLVINAMISAAILPLGYLVCRRVGLDRPAAYGVATVAALVPAAFFYSEYAITDAVFPVITLAWLLSTHTWLTASSARGRYAAAAGSALLAGYAYAVHSRGLVILAGYAVVGVFIAWRRPNARLSVAVAALTALVTAGAGWLLNRYLSSAIYPEGTRSLSGQIWTRLTSPIGAIHVFEMAAGQLWRLVLDSWGIAGIGLVAALAVVARREVRGDLRIMAALSVAVTTVIACTAPAALPSDQSQTWASGRYLDGMIVLFFLAGAVVLLRSRLRQIAACAGVATALFVLAAVIVAIYAGASLPTSGFGAGFNFAEPAVLTQNWNQANVALATAVTLGLLAVWLGFAFAVRRWPVSALASRVAALGSRGVVLGSRGVVLGSRVVVLAFGACVAAVSLVALTQMTSQVSRADGAQEQAVHVPANALRPGQQVALAGDLDWWVTVPEMFQVSWTHLQSFNPASQPPPAGVTAVETRWAGSSVEASWPHAPAGWHVAASSQAGQWVLWQKA
jgi:hypothetical protein